MTFGQNAINHCFGYILGYSNKCKCKILLRLKVERAICSGQITFDFDDKIINRQ